MQEITDRFKKELVTFFDFLDERYPSKEKIYDVIYVTDDFAYILFVFDKEMHQKDANKSVLGSFSFNNSSAFEPKLNVQNYVNSVAETALLYGITALYSKK